MIEILVKASQERPGFSLMKVGFLLLLGLVFGAYRELLGFVGRTRIIKGRYEIPHYEYYDLTIPHPAVGKVMDKLFSHYLETHNLNLLETMERKIKDSLGGLLPITYSKTEPYREFELETFFNGSSELKSRYMVCIDCQRLGVVPFVCINKLIDDSLEGVKRQHAMSATYFLEIAKRIPRAIRMPTKFRMKAEEDYEKDLFIHLCENVSKIANDRRTLLPQVIYALAMFRYYYNLASFRKIHVLSRAIYERMEKLETAESIFTSSSLQTVHLTTPHAIEINNEIYHVENIKALVVSQKKEVENDVMRMYIAERTLYVSFPQFYKDAVASIISAAKNFLLSTKSLSENPTSLPIPQE